ncbi:immunoglobulin superfamily member 5 [Solea senegalensis]|uniref:immunoglobulin superfamily member 5 n=1 Tax=Solea senegalensis TaxID=28829 RepID=UPI001C4111C2|nr:immunoglobulin superfamily member 5 [Solea senegalensis]XP_043897275.1 immunoglobulin superfamily member 5 [Solea senegalensis]XP_043897276.1 immunoglobulin superfamily member 5 [Solea senegalensis]KAG7516833.1 immunoglobulin superfamily member 5 [Solea senegalensis]
MSLSWKSRAMLLHICLLLCAQGVMLQQFLLRPQNSTVLHGTDASFQAEVDGSWQVMTWHVRGFLVLSVPVNDNVTSSSEQFSARFCSAGDTRCVEFTIHNVTRRESGPIMCTVLGEYGSKTAQLYVEETGTINILGGNVTATQDQEVAFQCVTNTWFPAPTITWTLNGHAVDSSLPNTTSVADGDSFNSTSILKFHAVGNTIVACHATVPTSTNPLSSSVFLGVVPKPPDWTVLIAVVLSFGCFALLVLLILGIIFCCKRRKEKQSTYQDEMTRRVRTLSQISSVSVPGQSRGQVNTGFELEGQTSVQAPSELSDHSSRKETVYAMPDIVNSNVHVYANSVNQSGIRKHRHVTIV